MSNINSIGEQLEVSGAPLFKGDGGEGPITRKLLRRTMMAYLICLLVGLVPLFLDWSPSWKAAGIGLWFPGGGFIAVAGWALLLFPLVLGLFAVSLIAWFGAGMITAPILIWLGSALLAGYLAERPIWVGSPYIVFALAVFFYTRSKLKKRKARAAILTRRDERNAYLGKAVSEAERRAVSAPAPGERELSEADLAALRYCFDLAAKPFDDFSDFETIEQFQTSALRYQLNNIGYTLSIVQSQYTPNFHGYMSHAQQQLIEKYLNKRVWSYWRWEKLWGHLSLNYDPAGRDNIMLTAFYGLQIALYMGNTGDMKYAQPGSLTFSWGGTKFKHDIHSLIRSIEVNFERENLCLYPCEPNWVYSACNIMGLTALTVYDRVFGTRKAEHIRQRFMEKLDSEFTNADGNVVALRSNVTGFSVAFPYGNESLAYAMSPVDGQRAIRAWAMARNDLIEETGAQVRIKNLDKGVDFGRYKKAPVGMIYMMLQTASEMGDAPVVAEAMRLLDEECGAKRENGALRYECSSTIGIGLARARVLRKDDWRNVINNGPADCTRPGPILTEAPYPQVLVAKAFSHGEDLELVLYPGEAAGPQRIKLERLKPQGNYRLTTPTGETTFDADNQGFYELDANIEGRTPLTIRPM